MAILPTRVPLALFLSLVVTVKAFSSLTLSKSNNNKISASILAYSAPPFLSFTALRTTEGGDDTTTASDNEVANPEASKPDAAMDILNSPEFLKRKLDVLKTDSAKAADDVAAAKERFEAGKAEWGPQMDDLQKEYQNIQQRMNSQSNKGDDMATAQVVREMLAVLDNFDRAFGQVNPSTDEEKAIEAEYRQAYDTVLEIFKKLGVEEVPTVGSEFDYEIHQAIMQKPSEDHEDGIVCDELQKGYKIGETLIRAAMVAVAM